MAFGNTAVVVGEAQRLAQPCGQTAVCAQACKHLLDQVPRGGDS